MPELTHFLGAFPTPRAKLATAEPYRPLAMAPPQYCVIPKQLSYWLNNQYGDCVTAEEAYAKACNNPEIFIADKTVMAFCSRFRLLNGADLLSVIQLMQKYGFQQDGEVYTDGDAKSVDYTSPSVLQSAIYEGPVKIGVGAGQLLRVANGKSGWFGIGFRQDHSMDHCVSLSGYGSISWLAQQLGAAVPAGVDGSQPGYHLFTWNSIGIVDVPSMLAITSEAWVRNPTTIAVPPLPVPPEPIPPSPVPSPIPWF